MIARWLASLSAPLGLLALLSSGLEPRAAAQSPAKGLALIGGALIDGTGAAPVRDSVVLIRGDRIERVGTVATVPVPAGYDSISTEGMTVLPGLWDLHVHLIYSGHPNPGAWFTHDAEFESVTIPASARQLLTISTADLEVARHLETHLNAPVAEVRRVFTDPERRVIYLAEVTYRGDFVHMEMDLKP